MKAGFFALASAATLYPKLPVPDLLLIENRRPQAMFLRGCPAAQDPSRFTGLEADHPAVQRLDRPVAVGVAAVVGEPGDHEVEAPHGRGREDA
jgi:hypothetical protein